MPLSYHRPSQAASASYAHVVDSECRPAARMQTEINTITWHGEGFMMLDTLFQNEQKDNHWATGIKYVLFIFSLFWQDPKNVEW